MSGPLTDRNGNVLIADEQGRVAAASPDDVQALLSDPSSGFRLATDEEVEQDMERVEYSDVGSQVAAGVEGAASGVTLGLSDAAIQGGLLGDDFAADSRKRAEHSSTARTVGEVAGIVGSSLATGGIGGAAAGTAKAGSLGARALGAGAKAISAPARGVLSLGRAAEGAVGRTVAKEGAGLLGRMAARGAQVAASGAIEGAAFGAGQELSRAALDQQLFEDPGLAAERIIAGAGMGAVIGGATGFAMGGATEAVASGARAVGKVFKGLGKKGDDVVEAARLSQDPDIRRMLDDEHPGALAALDDLQKQAPPQTDDIMSKVAAADELDDIRDGAVSSLREQQNRVRVAANELDEAFNVSQKPKVVRRLLKDTTREDVQRIRDVAARKIHEVEESISDLMAKADSGYYESAGATSIKKLHGHTDNLALRFDETISGKGSPVDSTAEAFSLLDEIKRKLGKAQVRAGRGANKDQTAALEIQAIRENLRGFLEDSRVWGDGIADFQKQLNAAWAPEITVGRAYDKMFGGRLTGMKDSNDLVEEILEADPQKIGSLVRGMGRAEYEAHREVYVKALAHKVNYARTAAALFDPSGTNTFIQSRVADLEKAAAKQLADLEHVAKVTQDAADWSSSMAKLKDAGDVVPFGGSALSSIASSGARALTLAKAISRGETAVGKAASGVLDRVKRINTTKPRRAAKEAVTFLGVKLAADSKAEEYQQMAKVIHELNQRQGGFAQTSRPIRQDVSQALDATVRRAGQYLATKVKPVGPDDVDGMFAHTRRPKVSPQAVRELRDAVERVADPVRMLERAAEGSLTVEDVEALKAVYPAVYQDLRNSVMDRLHEVTELPPYEERVRLGLLLDIPTDPSLEPSYIRAVQGNAATAGPPPDLAGPVTTPGNFRPPDVAGMFATRTNQILNAGAAS